MMVFKYILFLFSAAVVAQSTHPAQEWVNILAADSMHGRNYKNKGLEKAANFIANEFQKFGLEKVENSYFQNFNYPLNVIENASLKLNDKSLKFGTDFLCSPTSDSFRIATTSTIVFEWDWLLPENQVQLPTQMDKLKNKFVVFDWEELNDYETEFQEESKGFAEWLSYQTQYDFGIVGVVYLENQMVHGLANEVTATPIIKLKADLYSPGDQITYEVKQTFLPDFVSKNVWGKIAGSESDSAILVTAHYDHLGQVGDVIFNGANDNASGVAMMMSLAAHFAQKKPKHDMYFIAFGGEEAGLKGSYHFVENAPIALDSIKFLINLDLNGTGEEGIQIVNSRIFPDTFQKIKDINETQNLLAQIKERGPACNSDHCPFFKQNVPCFFIYTLGGVAHYHDPYDRAETLSLHAFNNLKVLLSHFIEGL